jgi:hypothetical protein
MAFISETATKIAIETPMRSDFETENWVEAMKSMDLKTLENTVSTNEIFREVFEKNSNRIFLHIIDRDLDDTAYAAIIAIAGPKSAPKSTTAEALAWNLLDDIKRIKIAVADIGTFVDIINRAERRAAEYRKELPGEDEETVERLCAALWSLETFEAIYRADLGLNESSIARAWFEYVLKNSAYKLEDVRRVMIRANSNDWRREIFPGRFRQKIHHGYRVVDFALNSNPVWVTMRDKQWGRDLGWIYRIRGCVWDKSCGGMVGDPVSVFD